MKSIYYLFFFFLFSYFASAQSEPNPNVKMDSSRVTLPSKDDNIFYEKIVSVDSATKKQLYSAARTWFSSTFNSGKSVLDMDDESTGKLIGKGNLVYTSTQKLFGERRASFIIDATVKDGRYRVQLSGIKDLTDEGYGQLNDYNLENLHPEKNRNTK